MEEINRKLVTSKATTGDSEKLLVSNNLEVGNFKH
jgi:hypothetical protein